MERRDILLCFFLVCILSFGLSWVEAGPPQFVSRTLAALVDVPGISGESGKVLTVNVGETGYEWTSKSAGASTLEKETVVISPASTTVTFSSVTIQGSQYVNVFVNGSYQVDPTNYSIVSSSSLSFVSPVASGAAVSITQIQ